MRRLMILLVFIPTVAFAQQIQPAEYVLRVTPAEVDIISNGLQTQPFGQVYNLINKLAAQVRDQQRLASEPPKPAEQPKE